MFSIIEYFFSIFLADFQANLCWHQLKITEKLHRPKLYRTLIKLWMDFSISPKFKFEIFFFQASSDDDKKDYTNLEKIQQFCRRFCTFIKGRFSRPESEVKVQGGRHLWKSDSVAFWITWLYGLEAATFHMQHSLKICGIQKKLRYTYFPHCAHFGSWKKARWAKFALVGLY